MGYPLLTNRYFPSMTSRERFLSACACQPLDRPPVWVMRQAGRVNADYRRIVDGVRREIDDALNTYDEPTTAAPPATLPPTLGELTTAVASDHDASGASASGPTDSTEEPQP